VSTVELHNGDCLAVLRGMASESVDAIVTDPPYGLSFMGKRWDYDVPSVEIWAECLRVLKPGGHLLAFAGTRTQHRMAVRIEDAGFEIRDMIAWVYGSGFPKSLNVAKAVDDARKPDARLDLLPDEALFCAWMREQSGLDAETVRRVTGSVRFLTGEVEIVNTATKDAPRYGRRAMVPTAEAWARLREHMNMEPPDWVVALVKEPPQPKGETPGDEWTKGKGQGTSGSNEWQGWGTALKPALEPITVARKPLAGTVAENVLAHGTGALNVDGCRVEGGERPLIEMDRRPMGANTYAGAIDGSTTGSRAGGTTTAGRWPANLIHDGSEEVLAGFPESKSGAVKAGTVGGHSKAREVYGEHAGYRMREIEASTGSAARFFYCAKASKADRGAENVHPTVKPTDLMRYLCRLVAPPGGVVLDPFTGSGSTGKAAVLEGFRFIGIEREAEYVEIARARIAAVMPKPEPPPVTEPQLTLFP
jgi:hypothetical protein